jgi:hypothetical protein
MASRCELHATPSPRTRTVCLCVLLAALSPTLSGCSSPRDEYPDTLLRNLARVHASLIKYKSNPSGVTEVNGQGITGPRSLAIDVAIKTKDFFDSVTLTKYTTALDIQNMQGYEAWAAETSARLRENADACLQLVREIKAEYKKNIENPEYRAKLFQDNIPNRQLPLLWLSKDGELVFALDAGQGVPVEQILRVDFKASLDSIRNQGKTTGSARQYGPFSIQDFLQFRPQIAKGRADKGRESRRLSRAVFRMGISGTHDQGMAAGVEEMNDDIALQISIGRVVESPRTLKIPEIDVHNAVGTVFLGDRDEVDSRIGGGEVHLVTHMLRPDHLTCF